MFCSVQNIRNSFYRTDFKYFIVFPAMIEPVVLVHGGAGDIPDSRLECKLAGVRIAANEGYKVLSSGGSVVDAVQVAVQCMEDNDAFNSGVCFIFVSTLQQSAYLNCNCDIFTLHESSLGYNPIDIGNAIYILYNTIHPILGLLTTGNGI
jgi:hypothetical protein